MGGVPLGQGDGPWQGGWGPLGLGQVNSSLWVSISLYVKMAGPMIHKTDALTHSIFRATSAVYTINSSISERPRRI